MFDSSLPTARVPFYRRSTIHILLGLALGVGLGGLLPSDNHPIAIAGVPRASLVTIAGRCQAFGLPAEVGVAVLLAVDELMDKGSLEPDRAGPIAQGRTIAPPRAAIASDLAAAGSDDA